MALHQDSRQLWKATLTRFKALNSPALFNIAWLIGDKAVRLVAGVVILSWTARLLGTAEFGLLNLIAAIVSFFAALAAFGLGSVAVRELVQSPENENSVLSTIFYLQGIGGIISLLAACTVIAIWSPHPEALYLTAILSSALVFKASDVARYWFEAHVLSRNVILVDNAVYLAFAAIKIALLFHGLGIVAYAYASFAESATIALALMAVLRPKLQLKFLVKFDYGLAAELLKESFPLAVSSLAVIAYMRIDQIMLEHMLGEHVVGIYSAAVRLSESIYFLPIFIVSSFFPVLVGTRASDPARYATNFQALFNTLTCLSIALAAVLVFFSREIVLTLYGPAYAEAQPVLVVHAWTAIFVFLGIGGGRWLIIERLQRFSMYRTAFGAFLNVALNFVLIPRIGAVGAAWSTLVAQACSSFLFNVANVETRPLFVMQLRALLCLPLLLNRPSR